MNLSVRHLCVHYTTGRRTVKALEDVSLDVGDREFVAIVGPSGCGKTTLLRSIAGILKPNSGEIEFIPAPGDPPLAVRMVFQEHALFPWMSVLDNATFGLRMLGGTPAEAEPQARELLRSVGLEGWEHAWPHQLSLGMKQRVNIVRCFLCNPALLLMDEPFVGLDAQARGALHQELLTLWQRSNRSVVFVTHDVEEAILLSDRVLMMGRTGGRVVAQIPVKLARPRRASDSVRAEFVGLKREILEWVGALEPEAPHL